MPTPDLLTRPGVDRRSLGEGDVDGRDAVAETETVRVFRVGAVHRDPVARTVSDRVGLGDAVGKNLAGGNEVVV